MLRFATAPELRCPQCKHAMQCHVGETVMALLPALPRPTASSELIKSIGILRERAIATSNPGRRPSKPSGGSVAASQALAAQPAAQSSILVADARRDARGRAGAGGYLAYQRFAARGVPSGLGEPRQDAQRPDALRRGSSTTRPPRRAAASCRAR